MAINDDLFAGSKRKYWWLRAHGCDEPERQRNQTWDYPSGAGGVVKRNGGIIFGREWDLTNDTYFRFVDSRKYRQSGTKACFGPWWVSYEVVAAIATQTVRNGGSIHDVSNAGYYLALVDEWGDRAWLAKARLREPLRAWKGLGNVAQGQGGRHIPPQHRKDIFQLFIPGPPELLERAFHRPEYCESRDALQTKFVGDRVWR